MFELATRAMPSASEDTALRLAVRVISLGHDPNSIPEELYDWAGVEYSAGLTDRDRAIRQLFGRGLPMEAEPRHLPWADTFDWQLDSARVNTTLDNFPYGR